MSTLVSMLRLAIRTLCLDVSESEQLPPTSAECMYFLLVYIPIANLFSSWSWLRSEKGWEKSKWRKFSLPSTSVVNLRRIRTSNLERKRKKQGQLVLPRAVTVDLQCQVEMHMAIVRQNQVSETSNSEVWVQSLFIWRETKSTSSLLIHYPRNPTLVQNVRGMQ